MARIWYSVCGEGLGHAVRSHTVISELEKRHKILITAAERAYPYLKDRHANVHRIEGNRLVYKDNRLMMTRCTLKFLKDLPKHLYLNLRSVPGMVKAFRPDVIISDFESTSHYLAKILKIPCVDIDNIHMQADCHIKTPLYLAPLIRFLQPKSDHQFILSYMDIRAKDPKRTVLVKPVLREELMRLQPVDNGFVLVYQTSETHNTMIPILKKDKSRFKIYGMRGKSTDNVEFCRYSDESFLEHLRSCRYVIVNGGFTVISEAIFLCKPILSIPIEKQFEQQYNAMSVQNLGYGMYVPHLSSKVIASFEQLLPVYRSNLKNRKPWNNQDFFDKLESYISSTISSQ